jgi:hypothetical protein
MFWSSSPRLAAGLFFRCRFGLRAGFDRRAVLGRGRKSPG